MRGDVRLDATLLPERSFDERIRSTPRLASIPGTVPCFALMMLKCAPKLLEYERASLPGGINCVRWDSWTPSDPATLAEVEEREAIEDDKRSKEFEESNPDFCKQMTDDMKTRSEARCT